MESSRDLKVDLRDPADIEAKLPQVEAILENMEQQMRDLEREITRWRSLRIVLRSLAGVPPPEEPAGVEGEADSPSPAAVDSGMAVQDLVVNVINREVRELRSKQVRAVLLSEGHDLDLDQVSNALWYAAEKGGLIRRTRRGWYAPLRFRAPAN